MNSLEFKIIRLPGGGDEIPVPVLNVQFNQEISFYQGGIVVFPDVDNFSPELKKIVWPLQFIGDLKIKNESGNLIGWVVSDFMFYFDRFITIANFQPNVIRADVAWLIDPRPVLGV